MAILIFSKTFVLEYINEKHTFLFDALSYDYSHVRAVFRFARVLCSVLFHFVSHAFYTFRLSGWTVAKHIMFSRALPDPTHLWRTHVLQCQ